MPKNAEIVDYKPKNEIVFDPKPKNEISKESLTDQLYAMTISAGMWLGFSALTYKEDINIISSKSP